jgi:pyridoxal phosphate-dependent aminotransferase EpsN
VLDDRVARRRAIFDRYREAFADLPGIAPQPEAAWGLHTRWLSVFSIDPIEVPVTPEDIVRELDRENIEARPVWRPMHMQPVFEGIETIRGDVAQRLFETGICLPSSSSLTEADQRRVIDGVRSAFSAAAPGRSQ